RIAFPDDFEDTGTMFVGVTDCDDCDDCEQNGYWHGCGGDVYMATDGSCIDLNVKGITTGCVGKEAVDICSLDIYGDADEAALIAGAFCCSEVYYSYDGGWEWEESEKDPTGGGYAGGQFALTHVIWYEDTALAATAGCEAAVSMSCGEEVGEFWNQISLMATDIDRVRWIDHSPGYVCGDSETMFMLTSWDTDDCDFGCQQRSYDYTQSLFRHDGTYWERVYCSVIAGADVDDGTEDEYVFKWVMVSPDFNTTEAVYLANEYSEMWRTTDAGCSWDKLTFPCAPRPCIEAMVVIDEDTVITGGNDNDNGCEDAEGYVYKTTRHGARPWDEYEFETTSPDEVESFALEPGYEDPGSILLGDDDCGVHISEDGGETWDLVGNCEAVLDPTDPTPNEDTYVVFDPGYATNNIIYASSRYVIARCIIDPDEEWADQEWETLCYSESDPSHDFEAIQVAGDTALYVIDDESVNGDEGGMVRSLNPDAEDVDDVVFELVNVGLELTYNYEELWLTCDTSDDGCAVNVLWTLGNEDGNGYNLDEIWVYEDTLAAPVVLDMPLDEQKLGTTDQATLSWNTLCGADC
ncbi:MAG: hypothetical protein KAT75_04900, partial [Dehalococcoidia bacterium]|nr:hypothetical protein [Dehalococcoidia bacterium]